MSRPLVSAAGLLLVALLGGCAAGPADAAASSSAASSGSVSPGTASSGAASSADAAGPSIAVQPAPGATVAPSDVVGTADLAGLSIVVLAPTSTDAATAAATATVVAALRSAADAGGATLTVADGDPETATADALAADADLVVGVGPDTVSAVDPAAASNLDRSFLVLGAQLAEPTENVVAVVWPGADARVEYADEDPGFSGADDYAAEAVSRGLAATQADADGYVIALG